MKIRLKLFIITSLIAVLILISLAFLTNKIIMKSFLDIERNNIIRDVERVNDALLVRLQSLDSLSHDYATWDDTYYAITEENSSYSDISLSGSLENSLSDFVLIMHNNGTILFAKDRLSGSEKDYTDTDLSIDAKALYMYAANNYDLLICQNESTIVNGMMLLPNGLAMIASRPVIKTDGTGTVQASVIFGEFIDEEFIEELSNQIHLSINLNLYDSISYEDKLLLAEFNKQISSDYGIIGDSDIFVQVNSMDKYSIVGTTALYDLVGEPVALLNVNEPRIVYLSGKNAVDYTFYLVFGIVILFIIIQYWLFNKFILSRMISIERQLRDISSKNYSSRIILEGKDELSDLSLIINNTIDTIEKSGEERTAVFELYPDCYFYVDSLWNIMSYKLTEGLLDRVTTEKLSNQKPSPNTKISLSDLFGSNIISELSKSRSKSEKHNKPVLLEFNISINGSSRIFESRIVTLHNKEFSLVLLRDITDRKKYEQELLERNRDLEKFNKIAIDRELRMSELKKELRDLKNSKNTTTDTNNTYTNHNGDEKL